MASHLTSDHENSAPVLDLSVHSADAQQTLMKRIDDHYNVQQGNVFYNTQGLNNGAKTSYIVDEHHTHQSHTSCPAALAYTQTVCEFPRK